MDIVDHHVHLGTDLRTGLSLSLEELLCRMEKYTISRAVVFPMPNVFPSLNPYKKENLKIYEYSLFDNRIIPFMFVHPFLDNEEYFTSNERFFKGFKLYCSAKDLEYKYNLLRFSSIFNNLLTSSKPKISHIGLDEGERPKDLLDFCSSSNANIIITHCGRFFLDDLKEISVFENVYLDISPFLTMIKNQDFVPKFKKFFLSKEHPIKITDYFLNLFNERVLFGTDSPWCDLLLEGGFNKEINFYLGNHLYKYFANLF
ncbi:MAG: amidohydrolase family protein [Candidatus Pacearchaeota archaeon]